MLKKIIKIFIICLFFYGRVYASQTTPQYFVASLGETNSVAFTGGATSSSINVDTGALASAIKPSFVMSTNKTSTDLTLSATTNYSGGSTNGLFNISGTPYIILTNSTSLPALTSITNIKTGTPTATSNPNAIAYPITGPATVSGTITSTYNTTNNSWTLRIVKKGLVNSSLTIPAGSSLSGTYSIIDESGSYQATITLTFI